MKILFYTTLDIKYQMIQNLCIFFSQRINGYIEDYDGFKCLTLISHDEKEIDVLKKI